MVGRVNERIVQRAMEQHHLSSASSQPKDAQAAQSNRDEPEATSGSATSTPIFTVSYETLIFGFLLAFNYEIEAP